MCIIETLLKVIYILLINYCWLITVTTGPQCVYIESTELPFGYKPLLLYNGDVSCLNLTGKIKYLRLKSHNYNDDQDLLEENVRLYLTSSTLLLLILLLLLLLLLLIFLLAQDIFQEKCYSTSSKRCLVLCNCYW